VYQNGLPQSGKVGAVNSVKSLRQKYKHEAQASDSAAREVFIRLSFLLVFGKIR
jgi:hypothetical protein